MRITGNVDKCSPFKVKIAYSDYSTHTHSITLIDGNKIRNDGVNGGIYCENVVTRLSR